MRRTSATIAAILGIALAAGLAVSHAGAGAPADRKKAAARIAEIGRTDAAAARIALELCRMGPRPAGSKAHERACEWALGEFKKYGLKNVHLEDCGSTEALLSGTLVVPGAAGKGEAPELIEESSYNEGRPVMNVVADIPGAVRPDEYVIVGAHIDSAPLGTGATDNAAGAAAVMEAARMLAKAGAKPKRTIRFILFAGEESGLVGSRGYVAAHPELVSKISAMFNMDNGTDFISGVRATEPMLDDMKKAFAPAAGIDPAMPFRVDPVDWLPAADPNLCARGCGAAAASPGCGGAVRVMRRTKDGKLEPADKTLEELGISAADIAAGRDSLGRRIVLSGKVVAGGCGAENADPAMRLPKQMIVDGDTAKIVAIAGSSDHAPFLKAGIPSFFFVQNGDTTVAYPIHSHKDTYEAIVPRYLEHSATVIAVGALGVADLDGMISRERLAAPAEPTPSVAPASGCGVR